MDVIDLARAGDHALRLPESHRGRMTDATAKTWIVRNINRPDVDDADVLNLQKNIISARRRGRARG